MRDNNTYRKFNINLKLHKTYLGTWVGANINDRLRKKFEMKILTK